MITLMKNYIDGDKSQKRINVKKMISFKELVNKQIRNIKFKFSCIEDLIKVKSLSQNGGETEVQILLNKDNKLYEFQLKNKRKVNNQLINSLKLRENVLLE